jgi:hypothetical protein
MQEHLPEQMQAWISRLGRQDMLFTAEQLRQFTSDNTAGGGKIYMAILGEVFDVTAKPEFYGEGGCQVCSVTVCFDRGFHSNGVLAAVTQHQGSSVAEARLSRCPSAVPAGAEGGYGHFAGVDGSKAFITGTNHHCLLVQHVQ